MKIYPATILGAIAGAGFAAIAVGFGIAMGLGAPNRTSRDHVWALVIFICSIFCGAAAGAVYGFIVDVVAWRVIELFTALLGTRPAREKER